MEKVTQGTAATAEESAAASEELSAQAETTIAAVAMLMHLIDGRSASGSASGASRPAATATPGVLRFRSAPAAAPRRTGGARERSAPEPSTGTFDPF